MKCIKVCDHCVIKMQSSFTTIKTKILGSNIKKLKIDTNTKALVASILTSAKLSLKAVDKKQPKVSTANADKVNAKMALALDKKVFIPKCQNRPQLSTNLAYQNKTTGCCRVSYRNLLKIFIFYKTLSKLNF